jgi:hypothetical protein
MKRSLLFTLSLIAALTVGYLAGYKHSQTPSPSEQLPSNPPAASTNSQWESFIESMQSEDQMTTALSLYSLRRLEGGEIQPTKEFLASRVAYFYLSYGPVDHPRKQLDETGLELLQAIHDFSQTNAILQAALKRRAEEFSK